MLPNEYFEYPWIDNFTRITDPTRITELDNALVETLRAGSRENIFLTPPYTLDVQEHRGFRYHHEIFWPRFLRTRSLSQISRNGVSASTQAAMILPPVNIRFARRLSMKSLRAQSFTR